jgi:uncharacterized protein (TIGR02588 family)
VSEPSRSQAEWVTFGVSLAVVVALVVTIVALWAGGESAADLVVREDGTRRSGDTYLVDAIVTNEGDATAANVQVVATLTVDGEVSEAEQVVDFLAGAEDAKLVFVFPSDPADGSLVLAVASFADP